MSKADNKELEEAIKIYNELKRNKETTENIDINYFLKFAETVLKELKRLQKENRSSIPKQVIEDLKKEYLVKIKQKQEKYDCDREARHVEEDGMLCELLIKLDFKEVVSQYVKTEKWYA